MSICIHQVLYPMYLPAPPALKSTQASRMNWKERTEPTTTYNLYLGLGLGVLQEPGVQPQPIPQPSPHTHTHTHTRGNKSLIPLSTFHFLYSTGIYLLPGTSMYTQYCSKNPKYAWTIHTTSLPPYLDHHYYRQYVRNLRNCRAETTYLVASLCIIFIIIRLALECGAAFRSLCTCNDVYLPR